jgi:hypothetical protein
MFVTEHLLKPSIQGTGIGDWRGLGGSFLIFDIVSRASDSFAARAAVVGERSARATQLLMPL